MSNHADPPTPDDGTPESVPTKTPDGKLELTDDGLGEGFREPGEEVVCNECWGGD